MAAPSTRRKRIGPYRIVEELGAGGMGVVWRAEHEMLNREVAIKELLAKSAREKEAIERFRREGMSLAQLRHESIVGIHDLFVSADKLYMVLEYVNGASLQSLIEKGPLPWDVVAIIGMRVASALEHAHYRHLIHRDIKPANIMLSKTGEVKLMDFGIAHDPNHGKLTQTGYAVGTPAYMPPETLTGARADAQSDLYSLGVTLYECAAGKHPFADAGQDKTFAAILAGRYTPLRRVTGKVPAPLRAMIEKCIQLDPKRRYRSAAELRLDLELLLAKHRARANRRLRIVGFLRSRGVVAQTEAMNLASQAELDATSYYVVPRRASPMRLIALLALLAASVGATGGGWWWASRHPEMIEELRPYWNRLVAGTVLARPEQVRHK